MTEITLRVRPIIAAYIDDLLATGLFGDTVDDVVDRLVGEGVLRAVTGNLITLRRLSEPEEVATADAPAVAEAAQPVAEEPLPAPVEHPTPVEATPEPSTGLAPDDDPAGVWIWDEETRSQLITMRHRHAQPYATIAKVLGISAEECEREFERVHRKVFVGLDLAKPGDDRSVEVWIDGAGKIEHVHDLAPGELPSFAVTEIEPSPDGEPKPAPDSDPLDDGSGKHWNPLRIAELVRLKEAEGLNFREIAPRLRSTAATCQQYYYLTKRAARKAAEAAAPKPVVEVPATDSPITMGEPSAPDEPTAATAPEPAPDDEDFLAGFETRHVPPKVAARLPRSKFANLDGFGVPVREEPRPKPVEISDGHRPFEATDANIATLLRMRTLGHTLGEIQAVTGGDLHELATKFALYSKQAKWWHVIEGARAEVQKRKAKSARR